MGNLIKKSQIGMEFLIIFGALLLMFTVFFLSIEYSSTERTKERDFIFVKEIASLVQNEVDLAANSMDGYRRNFTLPSVAGSKDYVAEIVGGSLVYVHTPDGKYAISLPIQEIRNITQGKDFVLRKGGTLGNVITKTRGNLTIA